MGFLEISFDEQTRLMEKMEQGQLFEEHWPSITAKDFFHMPRDDTLQGAYSHPKYGGNRNKAAWVVASEGATAALNLKFFHPEVIIANRPERQHLGSQQPDTASTSQASQEPFAT
jgi:hypothetical protein